MLANLPEKVRVRWTDHLLDDAEIPVHGWHRHDGQVQLMVTLHDGSRAYFPADRTTLWEADAAGELARPVLTNDAVRKLRLLVEALQSGHGRSRLPEESK